MKIYCAFLIFLILLYYDFPIRVRIALDFSKIKGYFKLTLFKINLINGAIVFSKKCNSYRLYLKVAGKILYFNLNNDKNDDHSLSVVKVEYIPKIFVKNANISFIVGIENDAFATTILYAGLQRILAILSKYFATNFNLKMNTFGKIVNSSRVLLGIDIKIKISLFYILVETISFLIAKVKTNIKNKGVNNDNGNKQTIGKTNGKFLYRA